MSFYLHERGWLDSDVWGNSPYSEREAWSWMIGEAAWKDCTVNVKGRPVQMKRGNFTASLRFLAEKWQWKKDKVKRYLTRLELWQMIEIETDNATGQTVVSVCNYDKYQTMEEKTRQQPRQGRDSPATGARQTRTNSTNSNKGNSNSAPPDVDPKVWEDFVKLRRTKRAPITDTALEGIRKQASLAGWSLEQALREMVSRGWQGFKAEWVTDNGGKHGKQNERSRIHAEACELLDEIRTGEPCHDAYGSN